MTEEQVKAIFLLAGFNVIKLHRIENKYWPLNQPYDEQRRNSPWWLVQTEFGWIEIGWRKRVISIDWEDTGIRARPTPDEVTKEDHMVHAYSEAKAVEYLKSLHECMTTHMIVTNEEFK
jgi:hypothetical protein